MVEMFYICFNELPVANKHLKCDQDDWGTELPILFNFS